MRLARSDAQRKANLLQRQSAIAADDRDIITGPKPTTWSARILSLCGDKPLRGSEAKEDTR